MNSRDRKLATLDLETDPFRIGCEVKPFVAGIFDGQNFTHFWGDDWLDQLCRWLQKQPPMLIYAHNGGRFDFLFMREKLAGTIVVIDDRIVKARIGKHELRDSFAALPVSLRATGAKDDVDYNVFRAGVRDSPRNRAAILRYLESDCRNLYTAVSAYCNRFDRALTVGAAAWAKLIATKAPNGFSAAYYIQKLPIKHDAHFRKWSFGGRVQAFKRGLLRHSDTSRTLTMIDKISMYPYVSVHYSHPGGADWLRCEPFDSDFAHVRAVSNGALPYRLPDKSLSFPTDRMPREYHATGHELRAAAKLGLVEILEDLGSVRFPVRAYLKSFVDEFFRMKREAEKTGDLDKRLHAKLILVAMAGKFATNPDGLFDYHLTKYGDSPRGENWAPCHIGVDKDVVIWRRPIQNGMRTFYTKNVATFASITAAARACLMEAHSKATNVLYCDTDSLLCEAFSGDIGSNLEQWKVDAECTLAAIVDKKMYALFDERRGPTKKELSEGRFALISGRRVPCVRLASAGIALSADQIYRVASGETVKWRSEAPSMRLDGRQVYEERLVHGVGQKVDRQGNRTSR